MLRKPKTCNALVLGFDWFRGRNIIYHPNPSGLVAEELNGAQVDNCSIKGVVLRVSLDYLRRKLEKLLEIFKPDIVIGLGLHPLTDRPIIELVGYNLVYSETRDVDGLVFHEDISKTERKTYTIPIDIKGLLQYLREKGYSVRPGVSIGTFLCNYVAFTMYKYGFVEKKKALFIHIPPAGDLCLRMGIPPNKCIGVNYLKELVIDIIRYLGEAT
ncbi:MAG: pyrrolidone-carboxylate peptidase [Staphylothermus sp.]|nr:pyrrolidone-carboxylate peptidase [Staphylothermus sp.]